ncbi:D-alanyl-D-alanine carboxypeptidase, partial [Pseudomonas sp. BGM005]|nr:D-alanyl-D-alanine carboxypeptidase [Pseudomonas sp. BG5]
PVLTKGTVVGTVSTVWGTTVDIVTDDDSDVVLWNGVAAEVTPSFERGEDRESGDQVGTLTSVGPLNTSTTPLVLAEDVD